MNSEKIAIWYTRASRRFQEDFRLSLITLFCAPALVSIGGFAVFRFIDGDMLMAAVDTLLVLTLLGILIFSWATGRTVGAGIVLVLLTGAGVLTVLYLAGTVGLFWAYVDILASFFLAPAAVAIPKIIVLVAGSILLASHAGFDKLALIAFATTAFVVSLFAYIFARRSKAQAEKMEELATRDPLTGAGNRRMLAEELEIALAQFEREATRAGLLMLDLDDFKEVNDRHGHAEGDAVLRQFASVIDNHSRRCDRLFRFGGEEFILLLSNTGAEGLEKAARHIHQMIRDYLTSPGGQVTCSIGGSLIQTGDTWEKWLHRSDEALYRAKNSGKDTIVLAETDEEA